MKLLALREDAFEDGFTEGKAEGKTEMIRNMLAKKFPLDTIAEISGMSPDYIQALV